MDARKPTLSGPTAPVVAQTGAIPDTYRKLWSTREGREREYARNTDSTHASYVQETKKRNAHDINRNSNTHIFIYIGIYNRVLQV